MPAAAEIPQIDRLGLLLLASSPISHCPPVSHLVLLVVEPRLQRLHHGVLGERSLQSDQVRDLRQGGLPHLLGQTALPPPLPLSWRGLRRQRRQGGLGGGVGLLAQADVGVVVLQAALSQPGPLAPQGGELVCNRNSFLSLRK